MRTLRWGETFRELLDTQRQDRRGPMPDPRKTTTTKRLPLTGATAARLLTPLRAGMPALDSIHKTIAFAPKAGGPTYHIMRTTETDAYEQTPTALKLTKLLRAKGAPPSAALASAVKAKPSTGDNFAGNDRKAAKLSKAKPATKKFNDLKDLIASLAQRKHDDQTQAEDHYRADIRQGQRGRTQRRCGGVSICGQSRSR